MIRIGKLSLILGIAIFFGAAAVPGAKADPVSFSNVVALQNSGNRVDLFSNPGTTLVGPQISFLVDITGNLAPGTDYSLLVTYVEAGGATLTQTFEIPAFGSIPPPFTQLFTFTSQAANYQGVMASLTIDIIGSAPDFVIPSGPNAGHRVDSYTYHFNVAQPVPEPVSLLLFGTGVLGLWRKKSARRKRRN